MSSCLKASHSASITSLFTLSMPSGSAIQKVSENFMPVSANSVRMQFGGLPWMARRGGGRADRELADEPRIGVVIGGKRNLHQRVLVGIGPVGDLLGHQVLVR